jgi:hypothetical protein
MKSPLLVNLLMHLQLHYKGKHLTSGIIDEHSHVISIVNEAIQVLKIQVNSLKI